MTEIKQKVLNTMSDVFEMDLADIPENAAPGVIENWDSIRHMNLVVALEEEFDIRFNDVDIADLITITLIESIIKEMKSV
jgi:acyl carrier protein